MYTCNTNETRRLESEVDIPRVLSGGVHEVWMNIPGMVEGFPMTGEKAKGHNMTRPRHLEFPKVNLRVGVW